MLPISALLLAGSMNAMAQESAAAYDKTLKPVVAKEKSEAPEGRYAVRGTETNTGKGT